jgi:hypothetical protein
MPYPLPGEPFPAIIPNPGDQTSSTGNPNANNPSTTPKKTPGRLLFDKLGETQFTSLKFSDARDGFGRQIDDNPLIVKSLPVDPYSSAGYIGIAPNEKDAASENKERIKRFFETSRGKAFINKQIGLQLSNTRLESVQGLSFNIGQININPGLITDAINIGRDIINNGFNQNNTLSAASLIKRPVNRQTISPLQTYNPQNTLDQIGSDPNTGWNHYDRFGPNNILSDNDKYLNIVTQNNDTVESKNNRLVILNKSLGTGLESEKTLSKLANTLTKASNFVKKYTNKVNSYFNQGLGLANSLGLQNNKAFSNITGDISNGINLLNNNLAIADKFISPIINDVIDQYEGGPGSINGIGPTIIKRYDNTSGKLKLPTILDAASTSLNKMRNLLEGNDEIATNTSPTRITKQYGEDTGVDLLESVNDGVVALTKREISNKVYDHGSTPSYETIRQTNIPPMRKSVGTVDLEDNKYIYNTIKEKPEEIKIEKSKKSRYKYFGRTGKFTNFDRFIPKTDEEKENYNESVNRVVFTPINPFTGNPFFAVNEKNEAIDGSGRLYFDAYISNFKDNYSPTWNDINYIGRSETFHVFTKFVRDISFTLQIPCFDPTQLRDRHQALSSLASVNAGSYSSNAPLGSTGNQKMGGVITYLRLGKYFGSSTLNQIPGEPGIITNFSITIPNDASWDIDQQLAHYLTVDVGFKVIHNALPQHSSKGFLSHLGDPLLSYEEIGIQEQIEKTRSEELSDAQFEVQKQALAAGKWEQSLLYANAENFTSENFGKGKKFTEKELLDTQGGRFEEFEGDLVPAEKDWKYGSF